jgi:membrane-bound lytic murein transglycosylase B
VTRGRSAFGVLGASALLVAVVGATSHLAGDESASPRRLVLTGGVPPGAPPGAPVTASPPDSHPRATGHVAAATPQSRYDDWSVTTSASTGVPARALSAYAAAQAETARTQPECGLSWPTLAGIGYVESDNGGHGDGLLASGRPLTPIVGVRLTGAGPVSNVSDTDGGELDGDRSVDRAVGPMQFLPSTWASWASDGDGDGVFDPQDIDDAALAAARYLCASGDLRTPDGWTRAVLSYNHSIDYLNAVFAASSAFADRSTS